MKQRIVYHTLFWLAYLAFKTYLNIASFPKSLGDLPFPEIFKIAFSAQLIFLIVKIPLVYTLFAIANRFIAKKWNSLQTITLAGLLIVLGTFAFTFLNDLFVVPHIYHFPARPISEIGFSSLIYNSFLLFFLCGIALAVKLVRLNITMRTREEETARKKLATELQFLKSQINPHFLFNTLNNIYGLARKKSDDTAEVVLRLSKLLRFMLYETAHKTIDISDELKVVKDYIELEKLRYGSRLDVVYTENIDVQNQQITPLILIPFIENAFKHGLSETRFDSYIHINTQLTKGMLNFMIENSKSETEQHSTEKIGLKNVKRQLELLYPEHSLDIQVTPTTFKVSLNINLVRNATL